MKRSFESTWLLPVSIALSALAWVPPLPIAGAQISDAFGAGGVALAVAGAWTASDRGMRGAPRPAAILGLAFALCASVSALVMHGRFLKLAGTAWLLALAAGVVAYASESEESARRIRRALLVAAVVGAVTGLVGAVLYFAGVSTDLLNIPGDLVPGHYPRIRGTMMRANALAGLVATGIVLLPSCDLPRRWRAPALGVLLVALVFTFSRSWIALAGAAGVYALALGPRRSRARDATAVGIVAVCAAAMLASAWLGIRLDPSHPWNVSIADEPGTRWFHVTAALRTVAAHPLVGVGPGRLADPTGWDSHFSLVNVAALMGIPAMLAYASIVGYSLVRAVRAARDGVASMRGVGATLVLFSLDSLARDCEDQRTLWILVGLALVLGRHDRATGRGDVNE